VIAFPNPSNPTFVGPCFGSEDNAIDFCVGIRRLRACVDLT